ncbi:MAG: hypothetical protein RLZ25_54 [Pseudomonadota bacterium]|jgi:UPF0716 protein FxsA
MPFPLKITLIVFPFVELALLAQIAAASGFFPTLGLLLVAASLGAAIIRLRGLSALIHMQRSARSGQIPAREMLNDGISAVGGLLLIIPGPLSDILGVLLQLPLVQNSLAQYLIQKGLASMGATRHSGSATIIEGDFTRSSESRQHLNSDKE